MCSGEHSKRDRTWHLRSAQRGQRHLGRSRATPAHHARRVIEFTVGGDKALRLATKRYAGRRIGTGERRRGARTLGRWSVARGGRRQGLWGRQQRAIRAVARPRSLSR